MEIGTIQKTRQMNFTKYTKNMFSKEQKQAYLTEKQHEVGKILIDLDFRYDVSVEERQHTKDAYIRFYNYGIRGI